MQEMLIFSNCFSFWLLQEKLSLPHPDSVPASRGTVEFLFFRLGTSRKGAKKNREAEACLSQGGGFLLLLVVVLRRQDFWETLVVLPLAHIRPFCEPPLALRGEESLPL